MCIVCIQYELGKITVDEVLYAFTEVVETGEVDEDHIVEAIEKMEKELEVKND